MSPRWLLVIGRCREGSIQRLRPAGIACLLAVVLSAAPLAADWTFHGTVDGGCQSDVVVGPGGVIHFVASRYRQFDSDGNEVVSEPHGDGVQFSLGFAPAIAVGDDGSAHLLTRQAGSLNGGYDITYERRNANGVWDRHYLVGTRVMRNYIVSVGWATATSIYATYTESLGNVWTDLHMFSLGASAASYLGAFHGISRVDTNTRMRTDAGRVLLASGKCDPDGRVYVLQADAGPTVLADLTASTVVHAAGTGRRGGPDVYVDRVGQFHLLYGASRRLYYNRYDAQGPQLQPDVLALDGLDEVYDRAGLGSVAASDDGQLVLAVGLAVDDTPHVYDGHLVSALSTDGGNSFGPRLELGRRSNSGEGRQAPKLAAIGKKFFLFFLNDATGQISLGIFTIDADDDGAEATVDCDDADPTVFPGAEEICENGRDDNCNGATDEGCSSAGGSSSGGFAAGGFATGGFAAGGSRAGGAGGAGPAEPPTAAERRAPGIVGGCGGCRAGGAAASGGWLLLISGLVAGAQGRRRRTVACPTAAGGAPSGPVPWPP